MIKIGLKKLFCFFFFSEFHTISFQLLCSLTANFKVCLCHNKIYNITLDFPVFGMYGVFGFIIVKTLLVHTDCM